MSEAKRTYADLIATLWAKVDEIDNGGPHYSKSNIFRDPALAITQLTARIAELEKALKPFAELTDSPDDHDQEGYILRTGPMGMTVDITAGDIRRARAVLSQGDRTASCSCFLYDQQVCDICQGVAKDPQEPQDGSQASEA